MGAGGRFRRFVVAGAALCAVLIVVGTVLTLVSVRVSGDSMDPVLTDGDRVLVLPGSAARFDAVVGRFTQTGNPMVKRVIALPGDRVEMVKYGSDAGVVRVQPGGVGPWYTVDNPAWREHWKQVASNCCRADGKFSAHPQVQQVPPGMLFVLGDNVGHSEDSRTHGWMPERLIVGVVRWRVFPPAPNPGSDITFAPVP